MIISAVPISLALMIPLSCAQHIAMEYCNIYVYIVFVCTHPLYEETAISRTNLYTLTENSPYLHIAMAADTEKGSLRQN